MPRALILVSLLVAVSACSAHAEKEASPAPTKAPAACGVDACTAGAARCSEDGHVERCSGGADGCGAWTTEAACGAGEGCHDGACAALSARQLEHSADLQTFVDRLASTSGSFLDLGRDPADILARARATLAAGDDDDRAYYRATRRALTLFEDGHVDLFSPTKCGTPELPELFTSLVGACTQPYQDHAVVSFVGSDNPLGLAPGDRIVGVDGKAGQAMMDAAFLHGFCGVGSSSTENRRFAAGTSLLATVHTGSTVTITHVDGTTEEKSVSRLAAPLACRYPHAGAHAYPAKATRRSDGVAVIEIPTFLLPTSPALTEEQLAQKIGEVVDSVKDAPGVVWDLRGNPGGATLVALSIVSGMPGFRPGLLARCATRKAGSVPFAAVPGSQFPFQVQKSAAFATNGKVAVVIDGLTTSAGDYFALAAKTMTDVKLVGAPSAGAFGGVGQGYEFGKLAPLRFLADEQRCTGSHGELIERTGVAVDTPIELAPEDLARGRDTVLEAAAALLR